MRSLRGILAAACLLTCVAACSSGTTTTAASTPPPPATTSVSKPKPTTTPTPTFTPAVSPAKLTGACPLLGNVELAQLLGVAWNAREPSEMPPEPIGPGKAFRCSYPVGELYVLAVSGGKSPDAMLKQLQSECDDAAKPVPGAGEAASYCYGKGYSSLVMVAKHAHGQLRVAEVEMGRSRADVCESLAKLLGERL
ncbi:hypothetical protein [Amycolatopsis solani]|uniref:hypothetical protein n=1 Tax=Amycolatopsis solani TaxID=3028615 RepID=UPI0025B01C52|nr:hypothetical protein [Amycolatopsis sp. MEP2-6]